MQIGCLDIVTTRAYRWVVAVQCAAALAASVGIGRFVFTPILPMMVEDAGLTSQGAALLATANYVGYFVGALVGILAPRMVRSRSVIRVSSIVLVLSLVGMPATDDLWLWSLVRLVAGVASALVFMAAVSVALGAFPGRLSYLAGWAFGGIGVGIVLSGALVLPLRSASDWNAAWCCAAVAAAAFGGVAWNLPAAQRSSDSVPMGEKGRRATWRFMALLVSYTLEGVGYIIAGTFLVVAISQSAPVWVATGSWIIVGLAAIPSSALLSRLGHRWSRSRLLSTALVLQAVGVALPGILGGPISGAISALLFGATFVGIGTLSLSLGLQSGLPRAVAFLTAGYAGGQIAGPLLVAPVVPYGFHGALQMGAAVIGVAAIAAGIQALPRLRRSGSGRDAHPPFD